MSVPLRHFVACIALVTLLALASPRLQGNAPDSEQVLRRFVEEFVALKPGQGKFPAAFEMGSAGEAPASEKPVHRVTFVRGFFMARYEVTQELYESMLGRNLSRWKGPRNSVEMVSWQEATEFCRRVTAELRQRQLLPKDEIIRLPSEAEWEYACRAGTTSRYAFGDDASLLTQYGWFNGNAKGNDPPVGAKKPNAWGLYDMHGYVGEWCQDTWHASYEGAPADGSAWEGPGLEERVVRGGAWTDGAEQCRSAYRHHLKAGVRSDAVGFRCVRAAGPG